MIELKCMLRAWLRGAALCLCAALPLQASAQAAEAGAAKPARLSAEAFMGLAEIQSVQISPSGRWVAMMLLSNSGRYGLGVLDMLVEGTGGAKIVAQFLDQDVVYFDWVNEDWLIFSLGDFELGSAEQRHWPGLFSVRRDGSEPRKLINMQAGLLSPKFTRVFSRHTRVLYVPYGLGDEIIVGWPNQGGYLPYRLNVATGEDVSLAMGTPERVSKWFFDVRGVPRVGVAVKDGEIKVHWRADPKDDSAAAWSVIGSFPALDRPWMPAALDAKGRLYVVAPEGAAGEQVLKRFDFATGKPESQAIVETPGFDFDGYVIRGATSGEALGVRVDTDAETTLWFDPHRKALQGEIDRRLPGRVNRLHCRRCDTEERVAVVFSYSDRDPGRWFLWRGPIEKPTMWRHIAAARKAIDPRQMATLDFHRFKARDGREIPVWVTNPAGRRADEPLPTVVLPHGGPWVRGGYWRWSNWPQFLASRGYRVLEPEFRGSQGFGDAHFRAGFKQWGTAMQDDLADAVAWAALQKFTDPKRVCIAGASYGGYATLMSLARHPDVYRCGAARVAVTEPMLLTQFTWTSDMSETARLHTLPVMLGHPENDVELLRAASPVQQAARIKAPVLLAMGADDRRVPIKHGSLMRDALQAAGNEPEYVVYEGEGHSWLKKETRLDFARRLEAFLERHLR
jgi:acetyl esterase/lipase